MKGFKDVELRQYDAFLDQFSDDITPVAVELRPNSEPLPKFTHPENALYIYGPEDGSIPKSILSRCHRFVVVPTRHCVNLAAAVYLTLYDRQTKMHPDLTIHDTLSEVRHDFPDNHEITDALGLVNTG